MLEVLKPWVSQVYLGSGDWVLELICPASIYLTSDLTSDIDTQADKHLNVVLSFQISFSVCLCRPAEIPPSEAVLSLNAPYLDANEGAFNMTRTSSANLSRLRSKATKQFVLRPGQLDFGSVRLGQVSLAGCMLELPVVCWLSGSTEHQNKRLHAICKIPVGLQRTLQQAK